MFYKVAPEVTHLIHSLGVFINLMDVVIEVTLLIGKRFVIMHSF
jgi:hypothetical protein